MSLFILQTVQKFGEAARDALSFLIFYMSNHTCQNFPHTPKYLLDYSSFLAIIHIPSNFNFLSFGYLTFKYRKYSLIFISLYSPI